MSDDGKFIYFSRFDKWKAAVIKRGFSTVSHGPYKHVAYNTAGREVGRYKYGVAYPKGKLEKEK